MRQKVRSSWEFTICKIISKNGSADPNKCKPDFFRSANKSLGFCTVECASFLRRPISDIKLKTPHFYDFWISEPITKPQNQLFFIFGDAKIPKTIKETPGTCSSNIIFVSRGIRDILFVVNFRKKAGTEKL